LDYIRDTRNSDPSMALEAALYSHADTGKKAAEMAMQRAGIAKEEIGLVIAGSSRPEMSSPADACAIADALELEVPSFDINSACTSMWAALYILA
ncbi:MAG: ketoacyl-ACP synthase III, partial [Candidatus Binatia bacterium]